MMNRKLFSLREKEEQCDRVSVVQNQHDALAEETECTIKEEEPSASVGRERTKIKRNVLQRKSKVK